MISRAVWLTPLLLPLCKGAAFCNEGDDRPGPKP
jgi:hypothetical protein